MSKKIAIDWDDHELRLVAAQCSANSVQVTDAALIPIVDGDIAATLRDAIAQRGLGKTDTLVAIGRGKAELRDLQLPPVPDDELPDMVRFQAIRSFASAGDSAIVDYLVTDRNSENVSMLAAAVGPSKLKDVQRTCAGADLMAKRIALRPLAASALYFITNKKTSGQTVLIDLLSDDAEIVVARDRKVVFVRTVRLPSVAATRSTALVAELRRSLMACGSDGSPDQIILWGRKSVHQSDVEKLNDVCSNVQVVNPFDLVGVDESVSKELPEHVGRLAPLVGLLRNDESGAHRLIDFMNPRKRIIKEANPYAKILSIGVPVAIALLLAFLGYRHLKGLDDQIASLQNTNKSLGDPVKAAGESVARTERVDRFLDGGVNWLDEIRRLAEKMPPSDKLIVSSITGKSDKRNGGGDLTVVGGVRNPDTQASFGEALRDESHKVLGEGSKENGKGDYRWSLNETILIPSNHVRNQRYIGLSPVLNEQAPLNEKTTQENTDEGGAQSEAAESNADSVEESEETDATMDESNKEPQA